MDTTTKRHPHLIGRCPVKGCKTTARVTGRYESVTKFALNAYTGVRDTYEIHEPRFDAVQFGWRPFAEAYRAFPCCIEHRRGLRWKPVIGRLVEDVKCGALCRNAKGPSCDCSCGGEGHGAGH